MFSKELYRTDIEPWILTLEKEDVRAIFGARYRAFYQALEQLLPDPRALKFLPDFAWLRRVRRETNIHYQIEDTELSDCSAKVRELIDRHVKGDAVQLLLEPIPIMSDRFSEEVKKLKDPRAKASRMEHAIGRTITAKLHFDPVFYETVKDRLERIIDQRREQRIDDAEEFKLLMRLRDDIKDDHWEDADSVGIPKEAFPFYGLLKRHLPYQSDSDVAAKLGELSEAVFDALKQEAVIDWSQKEDVQREMRRKIKRQLRLANFPAKGIEAVTSAMMDLARVRLT
jgi:type I restriction enzyme R subunit